MVPPLLINLSELDLETVRFDTSEVEKINPHRGAMRMIDGIVYLKDDLSEGIAYRDVRNDEFWVEGHIPGRPLFPGVLMIEAAAQLASFVTLKRLPDTKFLGFSGCDGVKFRGQVLPGDRMLVLGKEVDFRPRHIVCQSQIVVRGTVIFEATITGMPM